MQVIVLEVCRGESSAGLHEHARRTAGLLAEIPGFVSWSLTESLTETEAKALVPDRSGRTRSHPAWRYTRDTVIGTGGARPLQQISPTTA